MNINNNIINVRQKVPAHCRLIAVSKTQPLEKIMEAYASGHRLFGENKVQELASKYEELPKDIQWHMIGHLQSNKVKYIAPFVSLIHGVDSLKLLQEIERQGGKAQRKIPCLLQVFIAKEESKFGFAPDEVRELFDSGKLDALSNIQIEGLMGMASFTPDKNQVRSEFHSLRVLFDELKSKSLPPHVRMNELSMGMSSDFEIAIEEGSTLVRIGTAIFGERNINEPSNG
jgi:PLP dependent protein